MRTRHKLYTIDELNQELNGANNNTANLFKTINDNKKYFPNTKKPSFFHQDKWPKAWLALPYPLDNYYEKHLIETYHPNKGHDALNIFELKSSNQAR